MKTTTTASTRSNRQWQDVTVTLRVGAIHTLEKLVNKRTVQLIYDAVNAPALPITKDSYQEIYEHFEMARVEFDVESELSVNLFYTDEQGKYPYEFYTPSFAPDSSASTWNEMLLQIVDARLTSSDPENSADNYRDCDFLIEELAEYIIRSTSKSA